MDHIKDLLAEVNDELMMSDMLAGEAVLAEQAYYQQKAMQEEMPARFGRTWPDAHRIKKVSRSGSPYHVVNK